MSSLTRRPTLYIRSKHMMLRAFAASKVFQSGVSLDPILSVLSEGCGLGWFRALPIGLSSGCSADAQVALRLRRFIYMYIVNSSSCTQYKKKLSVMCFLRDVYLHSGTELIPLFPYLRAGLQKGGGGRRRYSPG